MGERKFVVVISLLISLSVHVAVIYAIIIMVTKHQGYGPAVTYIDINSIDEVSPSVPPVIKQAQHSTPVSSEQQLSDPDAGVTEEPPVSQSPPAASPDPGILTSSLGKGMVNGYFSSFADGKNLRDDIRDYYFVLLEKINNAWWVKAATLKESASKSGVLFFAIGRDGELIDASLQKSTGSRAVDAAIIAVVKEVSPFPPLPDSYPFSRFQAPLKITAPLRLFNTGNQE